MSKDITVAGLFDLENTIAADIFQDLTYPWEVLDRISDFILELGNTLPKDFYENRGEGVWVAKDATLAPTASITGPCIIDRGAQVRHCAFIRGSVIVGKNAVVGNSTELKNAILFDKVQVPHYNYVGDSILGFQAHMGAGSITSNVKADKSLIEIKTPEGPIPTGRKKIGAILGDHVEVGCGSVLNPGTVVGKNTNIYPLCSVRGVINSGSILKREGHIIKKLDL